MLRWNAFETHVLASLEGNLGIASGSNTAPIVQLSWTMLENVYKDKRRCKL